MSHQQSQAEHVPSRGGVGPIGPHHSQELLRCWVLDLILLIEGHVNRKEEKETRLLRGKEPCADGKMGVGIVKEEGGSGAGGDQESWKPDS